MEIFLNGSLASTQARLYKDGWQIEERSPAAEPCESGWSGQEQSPSLIFSFLKQIGYLATYQSPTPTSSLLGSS